MKKKLILLTLIISLTGCAETIALLGPASSIASGGGRIIQSSVSSAVNYGIKKKTGKGTMQHALAYVEEKNPNKKKDRCLSFVKATESKACYIAKKEISLVKKSATKKIKNIINQSKPKVVKKIKVEQELSLQAETKKVIFKNSKSKTLLVNKNKIEQESQLRSVESMLVESVKSKKQISHLSVSIKKIHKKKDSSK